VGSKDGETVPELSKTPERVASAVFELALVTTRVYVEVVVPSPAVTTTSTVLEPGFIVKADDAAPETTVCPATCTEAPASDKKGVIVKDAMLFTTVAVYVVVPGANVGDKAPELRTSLVKVASVLTLTALVTTMVYTI
jgi:hypothetical protein